MAVIWKDATSYSQGMRGNQSPDAWECVIEGIRVWIGSGHRYYPGEWVMHCRELGMDSVSVGPVSALSELDAKAEALRKAGNKADLKSRILVAFSSVCND